MKRLAHYSQYFLRSPSLVKELLGHTKIRKSDLVFDIGAGSGIITSVLANKCSRVVAVELEPRMVKKLRANMAGKANVTIVHGDFLSIPAPQEPYKIFANIPFHICSKIVRHIAEAPVPPQATYLIVQKQFANKLWADSSHFTSQLGMQIGPWFSVRIRKPLRRTDFWPHPNVDTVLLEIIPRQTPLLPESQKTSYRQFTARCFTDPHFYKKITSPPQTPPSRTTLEWWVSFYKQKG